MNSKQTTFRPSGLLILGCLIILFGFWVNLEAPLQGVHSIRQADTLFSAYSYCKENTSFMLPKLPNRGLSSGIGIGEFPLYSYVISLPCKWSGIWSEQTPKFFVLIFWIILAFILGKYISVRTSFFDWNIFLILFLFSTHSLLYYTISIPDSLALIFIFSSALIFQKNNFQKNKILYSWIGSLMFFIGFAMRPYLLPLIFLIIFDLKTWIRLGLGSILVYLFWYKYWIFHSEVSYYYTALMNPFELRHQLGQVIKGILEFSLRNILNIIGLIFLFYCFFTSTIKTQGIFSLLNFWNFLKSHTLEISRKMYRTLKTQPVLLNSIEMNFWNISVAIGSIVFVVLLRGEHILIHGYYLGAASIPFLFLATQEISSRLIQGLWKKKYINIFLTFYILIGLAQTQHHWHAQAKNRYEQVQEQVLKNNIKETDLIAVYASNDSCSNHYLYWAKRSGWCLYERDFHPENPCPPGAQYYLFFNSDPAQSESNRMQINKCPIGF